MPKKTIEVFPPSRELVIETDLSAVLPPAPKNWEKADLPKLYERAREALKKCNSTDECAEWTRRADAFASYYRQARDKTLFNLAQRIRLRAMRRCGELFLKMTKADQDKAIRKGGVGPAAASWAKRLAGVDQEDFERGIAMDPPANQSDMIGAKARFGHSFSGESRMKSEEENLNYSIYRSYCALDVDGKDPESSGAAMEKDEDWPLSFVAALVWLLRWASHTPVCRRNIPPEFFLRVIREFESQGITQEWADNQEIDGE